MCCENNERENTTSCCLHDLLEDILRLQNRDEEPHCKGGCDKPFLGPTPRCSCYNTRPLSFYNCQTGDLWRIQFSSNGEHREQGEHGEHGGHDCSTVFRIEDLDDCCCTCRVLVECDGGFKATSQFFTIDLNCVSAVQCHPDTFVDLC